MAVTLTPPSPGLKLLATVPVAGVPLQNGTPTFVAYTFPADGALHRYLIFARLHVTTLQTGGAVAASSTTPDGLASQDGMFAGALAAGAYAPNPPRIEMCEAGTVVSVVQTTAQTAGAAQLWAEIWGL